MPKKAQTETMLAIASANYVFELRGNRNLYARRPDSNTYMPLSILSAETHTVLADLFNLALTQQEKLQPIDTAGYAPVVLLAREGTSDIDVSKHRVRKTDLFRYAIPLQMKELGVPEHPWQVVPAKMVGTRASLLDVNIQIMTKQKRDPAKLKPAPAIPRPVLSLKELRALVGHTISYYKNNVKYTSVVRAVSGKNIDIGSDWLWFPQLRDVQVLD